MESDSPRERGERVEEMSVGFKGDPGIIRDAESGSLRESLLAQYRSMVNSTGSQQPSPLSQSTLADNTAAQSAASSMTTQPGPQQPGDAAATSSEHVAFESAQQRKERLDAELRAEVDRYLWPDGTPRKITVSGNTSPDASLEKDYHREKGKQRRTDTDDENSPEEENGDPYGPQGGREKKHYRKRSDVSASDTDGGSATEASASSSKKPSRKLKTFEPLQRKEEERAKAASEPTVTITGPGGEKIVVKKGPVHPNTNYDRAGSRGVSPNLSDSDEMRDIKHAQTLPIWASPIDNITPQRVIRTILRGDYRGIQKEAKFKKRKSRTYFVATDISEEAAYALEWTIGTVLRDGDTLLAIYAVNRDTGTGESGDPERIDGLQLSEGALAMQDTTATMEQMTSEAPQTPISPPPSGGGGALAAIGFGTRARRDSDRGSKDSRVRTKGEAERLHAIDVISETCINFLRRTRLQVRVTVEVISCKSPKHMITEAIDYFEPTLVILGSRGRGALKGTLLGSFSNYLVAKSSIPVMVARKKLRGRKAMNVNPTIRLANNLIPTTTDSRLARARID